MIQQSFGIHNFTAISELNLYFINLTLVYLYVVFSI